MSTRTMNAQIGRMIRGWREGGEAPLTRDELARKTGYCVSTIRNWEIGRVRALTIVNVFDLEYAKAGIAAMICDLVHDRRVEARRRRSNGHAKNGHAKA